MSDITQPESWLDRAAKGLVETSKNGPLSVEWVKATLEAAQEIKCVTLRVLLARCYELLSEMEHQEDAIIMEPGFLDRVQKEIE